MTERKNQYPDYEEDEESKIDYRLIIDAVVLHWKWFAVSVIFFLVITILYFLRTTPVYSTWTDLLIKEDNSSSFRTRRSNSLTDFSTLGFVTGTNGFDNEMAILGSYALSRRAAANLKLYVSYAYKGFWRDEELYKNSPVTADMSPVDLDTLSRAIVINITPQEEGGYVIKSRFEDTDIEESVRTFPYNLNTPQGVVTLMPNPDPEVEFEDKTLKIVIARPRLAGDAYRAGMEIEATSKLTTIARLTMNGTVPQRTEDFLNELVRVYNESANEIKNEVALKTEAFINNRLRLIDNELGATESNLESFKKQNQLANFESDADVTYRGIENYQEKQITLETQLMLVNSLREYVEDPNNYMEIIPANLGITDAALNKSIDDYNQQVVERKRLLVTSPETSPVIQQVNTAIAALYPGIKHSLLTVYENLRIQKRSVDDQYNTYMHRLGQAPTQERELLDIERQQSVKATLYEILLQKREENSISLASTVDKAQVVDAAESSNGPISPRKKLILIAALFFGIAIPAGLIYIVYQLNLMKFKIEGRNDIKRLTDLTILADIFVAKLKEGQRAVVVRENANGMMEEVFRNLRTNLDFVLSKGKDEKVIMVTSMIAGEGKTFVSSNLAMSEALRNRKTLLVGLDIRKPRLSRLFSIDTGHNGITTYLNSTDSSDAFLQQQIFNSGRHKNLDILPSGVIPPNPGEIISSERLDKAFAKLRQWYDIIIIDTPPLGLVSDSLLLGRVVDVTLVVCRCDFSLKNNFTTINEINEQKKLPKMNLVLNGIDLAQRKYAYYYGYGNYGKRYGQYGSYGTYGHYGHYAEPETTTEKKRKKLHLFK